jgi:hypothetical protein
VAAVGKLNAEVHARIVNSLITALRAGRPT